MFAQQLSELVTIKRPSAEQGPDGQPVDSWEDVASVWANVRNLSGSESIRADKEASKVRVSIRVLYRDDVNSAMRVVNGGTTYEILAVLPEVTRKIHMDLDCEVVQ